MLNPERDENGFLKHRDSWNTQVAAQLAAEEGIRLSDGHWEIIYLIQKYYEQFDSSPAMRALCKFAAMELGKDKSSSIYLMSLFPGSPAKISAKIAGLPKPANCL